MGDVLYPTVYANLHSRASSSLSLQDYQAIVDAEWNILYDKLEKIHHSGAKVVLSKLPIGDVATQYFADRDMFCAGRVPEEDLKRTMMVTQLAQAASWPPWPWGCLFTSGGQDAPLWPWVGGAVIYLWWAGGRCQVGCESRPVVLLP